VVSPEDALEAPAEPEPQPPVHSGAGQ
jgi:hypothetical protein